MGFQKLSSILTSKASNDLDSFFQLTQKWEWVVGKNLCGQTQPLKLIKSTLIVMTMHSSISQHLHLMNQEIISKIERHFPRLKGKIQEIRYQVNSSFFKDQLSRKNSEKMPFKSKEVKKKLVCSKEIQIKATQLFKDIEDSEEKEILISLYCQLNHPSVKALKE